MSRLNPSRTIMLGRLFLWATILLLSLVFAFPSAQVQATDFVPTGFVETLIAQGLKNPTNMAVAPDGRVFVLEQQTVSSQGRGYVRVVKNGALLPTPFVTINGIDINGEHGLLGIAFDPNFSSNRFLYLFYTLPGTPGVSLRNEVWRYTADLSNPDVAEAGSGVKVIQFPPISASFHVGGSLHFHPVDGKLYISIGDDLKGNGEAQNINDFRGRFLRYTINTDGTFAAPADNPWYNQATTEVNKGSWAMGLRNPFQFAIQPTTGLIFANDVGQDTTEEINTIQPGKHYGWQFCEGPCVPPNSAYTSPVHHYPHVQGGSSSGGCAITGGVFYNPTASSFPAAYVGKYFFSDYCNNWLKYVNPASPAQATVFATSVHANPVALDVSPTGSLYYLARGLSASDGKLFRIDYAPGGLPTFNQHPASKLVSAWQTATFTCSASSSTTISYQWQRRNPGSATFQNIGAATGTSYTTPATTIPNDNGALYRCEATNTAGVAYSQNATLTVVVGTPPSITISLTTNSTARQTWLLGDTVAFSFTATDAQDGVLPASAFTWSVDLYHEPPVSAIHTHPILPSTSDTASGSFDVPATAHDIAHLWYRINVRAIDSSGLFTDAYKMVESSLTAPANNSAITSTQPTLDWQPIPGATGYEVYLGLTDTPTTKVSVSAGQSALVWPATLIPTRTYYWYVTALFSGGASAGTDTWRFHLVSADTGAPSRNFFTTDQPTFTWSRIDFATGYRLQIATDASFAASTLVYEATVTGGATLEHQVSAASPLAEGVYYWRVAAIRPGDILAPYSPAQVFTVKLG